MACDTKKKVVGITRTFHTSVIMSVAITASHEERWCERFKETSFPTPHEFGVNIKSITQSNHYYLGL
jgi:hypothetical protein